MTSEERDLWRLAYLSGVNIPSQSLKSIWALCQHGPDPQDLSAVLSQITEFSAYNKDRYGTGSSKRINTSDSSNKITRRSKLP